MNRFVTFFSIVLTTSGCIDLSDQNFLPVGTPFTVSGVASVADNDGPCLVWLGDNGVTYHLFQDPLLDNDQFDQITSSGTRSRLVLVTRSDLEVQCEIGTIVEVEEVLEIE